MMRRATGVVVLASLALATRAVAQDSLVVRQVNDSVAVRFTDVELRAVIQALGRYLDRPVLVGNVPSVRVTFESPVPVPRAEVRSLLRGLVQTHGLEFVADSAFYRVSARIEQPMPPAAARAQADEPTELFVLRLRHARATDVAATVGALFGIEAGGGSRGLSSGTLSDELRRSAVPPVGAPSPREGGSTIASSAEFHGSVVIVADETTNALLIRASRPDYELVLQAVHQLDLRPLQVLIQVLIVEARKDHFFSLGVNAETGEIGLAGDATLTGTLTGGGLGQIVLHVMRLGRFDLDAMLRLAVSRGDARIVSRPVLLASNNREARILVGSQRPFVQVSRSLPTDTPTRDQVIQYRDVGTKLTVLPTINADGYVALLIRQEVNNATNETQFDAPIISTREAETEVLVKDGQTIVLGGLRERQFEVTRSGIPVLSDIPILGGLFGSHERRAAETELFLFITPMVLADDASAETVTHDVLEEAGRAVKTEVRGK